MGVYSVLRLNWDPSRDLHFYGRPVVSVVSWQNVLTGAVLDAFITCVLNRFLR